MNTNLPEQRRLVTIQHAADYLHCAPLTIRRMIARGQLSGFKIGPGPRAPIRVDMNEIDQGLLRPIPTAPAANE